MARDILRGFGPDSASNEKPRATNGGYCEPKPLNYKPPIGPSNINDAKSPGLHGTNHGNNPK